MLIRFTKIQNGVITHSSKDDEDIIISCFEPCTKAVRQRVIDWINDPMRFRITLCFKDFKVRLDKVLKRNY